MAEEFAMDDASAPKRRAARARRRADEAQQRISELRDRRMGAATSPARHQDDLRSALEHAREAHDHLLGALESSAVAHERASARYFAQAQGDPRLEAKARRHLEQAEADRARAEELTDP
jgi:hypothetical protein